MLHKIYKWFSALIILHRVETIPFLLASCAFGPSLGLVNFHIYDKEIILAFLLNVLIAYHGLLGNNYSDYELDKEANNKKRLTDSIDLIGKRILLFILFLQLLFIITLFYINHDIYRNKYVDIWFWSAIVGRYIYNFHPFRLKEKGIWNTFIYAVNFGATPVLLACSILFQDIQQGIWFFVAAGFLMMASQSLWGAAVDYNSDKKSGANTCAVFLGLRRSLLVSQLLLIASLPIIFIGIFQIAGINQIKFSYYFVPGLLLISAGYIYSLYGRHRVTYNNGDKKIAIELQKRMRELSWLIVQTNCLVIGIILTLNSL